MHRNKSILVQVDDKILKFVLKMKSINVNTIMFWNHAETENGCLKLSPLVVNQTDFSSPHSLAISKMNTMQLCLKPYRTSDKNLFLFRLFCFLCCLHVCSVGLCYFVTR